MSQRFPHLGDRLARYYTRPYGNSGDTTVADGWLCSNMNVIAVELLIWHLK